MIKKRKIYLSLLISAACVFISSSVFAMSQAPNNSARARQLTVNLEGIFDAKVTLLPFKGLKTIKPIAEAAGVKEGKSVVIKIPVEYLPGEFLLRIDYRAKESDHYYPAERIIYVNEEDIGLTVNPPYINNDEKTKFNSGEKENTVYGVFMKENSAKRMPIDLLRQLLLSYDLPKSEFYAQAVKEFESRRIKYNAWLKDQARVYKKLYVSRLFQFQYIPAVSWSGDEFERLNQILKNYFEGIDFSDPLIIRSREFSRFMDIYMGLYGAQAKTAESRDALFTQAGRVACEKASFADPRVYGWMVDYFYTGYETYNIKDGMIMLQEHINNPKCLTSKKEQIIQRLEGMRKLIPGANAPDFVLSDKQADDFQFHKWVPKARYKLLLFWTTTCADCLELVNELSQWYNQPANKNKADIITVNLDEAQIGVEKWKFAIKPLSAWKNLQAKGGVNSPVARAYAILSTPVMFLVDSKSNKIVSVPETFEKFKKEL